MASEYKFKIGDRVKVINPKGNLSWSAAMGEIVTINQLSTCPYVLRTGPHVIDGTRYCGSQNCFELVEQPSKFKVGDRVRSLEEGSDIRKGAIYTITQDSTNRVYLKDDVGSPRSRSMRDYELVEQPEDVSKKPKFKIGDRVRITHRLKGNVTGLADYNKPDGDVGKIGIVYSSGEYDVTFQVREESTRTYLGWFLPGEELEPVESKAFKVGDLVKVINPEDSNYGCITRISDWSENNDLQLCVDEASLKDNRHNVIKIADLEAVPEPMSTTEGTYTGESIRTRDYSSLSPMWEVIKDTAHVQALDVDKPIKKEKRRMTTKYYRTKQNLPDLEAGAILKLVGDDSYESISDLWDTDSRDKAITYDTCNLAWNGVIVENSPEWFERIYEVGVLGKTKYLVKSAAQTAYGELHKAKDTK
jgi:hypothetical protein